jgi:hypothetical protein
LGNLLGCDHTLKHVGLQTKQGKSWTMTRSVGQLAKG